MEDVTIETPRFILRSLTESDASERYLSWLIDTSANRFIVSARPDFKLDELRAFIADRALRNDVLFLGIFERVGMEHIGNIKYEPICHGEEYAVMGLLVGAKEWRGKGVAGEVLSASIKWIESKFQIKKILLGVSRSNDAALRSYVKFGFVADEDDPLRISSATTMAMVYRLGK